MNAVRFAGIVSLVIAGLLVSETVALAGQVSDVEIGKGEEINSGFVFYEGKYVEAPYRIECRDLAVYLNGIRLRELTFPEASLVVTEDPGQPEGLTPDLTLDDLREIKWEGRMPYYTAKLAYLWGKYGKEEAQERMMAYYRSLPCIKEAIRVEGDGVRLTDHMGTSRVIDLFIPRSAMVPVPSEEERRECVDELASIYRKRLLRGDCCFFFKEGTEILMGERKAANVLREMEKILTDETMNPEEKRLGLLSLGFIAEHDAVLAEPLVSNFEKSAQLRERLEALQAEMVQKYGRQAVYDVDVNAEMTQKQNQAIHDVERDSVLEDRR